MEDVSSRLAAERALGVVARPRTNIEVDKIYCRQEVDN